MVFEFIYDSVVIFLALFYFLCFVLFFCFFEKKFWFRLLNMQIYIYIYIYIEREREREREREKDTGKCIIYIDKPGWVDMCFLMVCLSSWCFLFVLFCWLWNDILEYIYSYLLLYMNSRLDRYVFRLARMFVCLFVLFQVHNLIVKNISISSCSV